MTGGSHRYPLLVTGGSGRLAAMVIDILLDERGVDPGNVIITTRDPARLSRYAARGVAIRPANFDEPEGLRAAFRDARRVLLIPTADVDRAGRRVRQHSAAIAAAKSAGVDHLCYVSSIAPEPGTPCFWEADHYQTELAVKASGMSWSLLRHQEQMDWHLLNDWAAARRSGVRYAASGEGRCAYVSQADCALAAARLLDSGEVENRTYAITGPEALTVEEVMAAVSVAAGKPIRVIQTTDDELRTHLLGVLPTELLADALVAMDGAIRDGLYAGVSDDLPRLMGRPATTLRQRLAAEG